MWYVAFTLGLFGSLHCVGMCGPLAIAFGRTEGGSLAANVYSGVSYNLGRTLTYGLLGLLFGTMGSFVVVADMQSIVSVLLGGLLLGAFLFSIDIDKQLNSLPLLQRMFYRVRQHMSHMYDRAQDYPSAVLGMVNGLLPCGLVYLALAGALASGGVWQGMLFMILFGLGTLPMLLAVILGYEWVSPTIRFQFRKVLPYVTLSFGLFLIYRGVVVDMPTELNFWEALRNPIMCH